MQLMAVALPPGRARLAIKRSGLSHTNATIGIGFVAVASFAAPNACSRHHHHIHVGTSKLARKLREEIDVPLRRFGDERDILTLYVSQVTQSLPERALLRRIVGGRRSLICEHADAREFVRLLRIGGEGQQTLAK